MTEQRIVDPESEWTVEHYGDNSAQFEHEEDGVTVSVDPVHRSSTHRSSSSHAKPRRYRVQLQQDWFGTSAFGDQQMSDNAGTFEDGLTLAKSFIQRYDSNRGGVARDYEETDVDTGVANTDALMATEVATKSVIDATGYSDEHLLETLQNLFGDGLKLVIHRDQNTIERVFGHESADLDTLLWSVGALPTWSQPLTRLSPEDEINTMMLHAGEHRWLRFVSTPTKETVIVVDDDLPVEVAGIERIIDAIVAEYHEVEAESRGRKE